MEYISHLLEVISLISNIYLLRKHHESGKFEKIKERERGTPAWYIQEKDKSVWLESCDSSELSGTRGREWGERWWKAHARASKSKTPCKM